MFFGGKIVGCDWYGPPGRKNSIDSHYIEAVINFPLRGLRLTRWGLGYSVQTETSTSAIDPIKRLGKA